MNMEELIQKFYLLLLPGAAGMRLYDQLNIHPVEKRTNCEYRYLTRHRGKAVTRIGAQQRL